MYLEPFCFMREGFFIVWLMVKTLLPIAIGIIADTLVSINFQYRFEYRDMSIKYLKFLILTTLISLLITYISCLNSSFEFHSILNPCTSSSYWFSLSQVACQQSILSAFESYVGEYFLIQPLLMRKFVFF